MKISITQEYPLQDKTDTILQADAIFLLLYCIAYVIGLEHVIKEH